MKNLCTVVRYIIKNNQFKQIPKYLIRACCYQLGKRMTKGIFSKKLFNGQRILLFPNNPISSAFTYTEIPDKAEILALRAFANNQTIFLDIGANVGAYSLQLMDKVHAVYAFEAHPITANYCKMNFLLNNLNPKNVIQAAVSDNSNPLYLTDDQDGDPTNSVVSHETGLYVRAITLDHFVQEQNFDVAQNFILKIDVEGFEYHVLQGAKEFLQHCAVNAIIFETFSDRNVQVIAYLKGLGYHLKAIGQHNMLASRVAYA